MTRAKKKLVLPQRWWALVHEMDKTILLKSEETDERTAGLQSLFRRFLAEQPIHQFLKPQERPLLQTYPTQDFIVVDSDSDDEPLNKKYKIAPIFIIDDDDDVVTSSPQLVYVID